jgi:hypothetical protein
MTMDLGEVASRMEIRSVVSRLARGTDRRDKTLLLSCYQPDGIDDHNVFRGPAKEFVEWVTGGNSEEWVASTHMLGSSVIEFAGDTAVAETPCIAHHVSKPHPDGSRHDYVIAVRYCDRFERRSDGNWLIAVRTVIYDWTYRMPLQEEEKDSRRMPFPENFTVGASAPADPSYAVFAALHRSADR